jgi:diaminohydroxyphosphoribosylaminopyrimidine deaminase/5-amino-6-(5-phosphoribosylamino)uracil reductase
MISDSELMVLALRAAARGGRAVRPNPQVGCAIQTRKGIVFVGHHAKCGGPHAEIVALEKARRAGADLRGATIAVTLEPCAHFGKTPPCATALIEAQVKKILIATKDPNPLVAGRGIRALKKAGLKVTVGLCEDEAMDLNREWLTAHQQKRSFVTLKMATSIDGAWTANNGQSKWITGPIAREWGHRLRAQADLLVTGAETIRRDDPQFTVRLAGRKKVLVTQPPLWVLSRGSMTARALKSYRVGKRPGGAQLIVPAAGSRSRETDGKFLKSLLQTSHQQGLHHVLVEAGPELSAQFLDFGLVNEIVLFVAPKLLGGPQAAKLGTLVGGALPGIEVDFLEIQILPDQNLRIRLKPR